MLLKATEQSDTGLNTKFVNVESGRRHGNNTKK